MSLSEYRGPVLGLIFLAYAEHRFDQIRPELEAKATPRRPVTPRDYRARSVLFVPDEARLSYLVRPATQSSVLCWINNSTPAIPDEEAAALIAQQWPA